MFNSFDLNVTAHQRFAVTDHTPRPKLKRTTLAIGGHPKITTEGTSASSSTFVNKSVSLHTAAVCVRVSFCAITSMWQFWRSSTPKSSKRLLSNCNNVGYFRLKESFLPASWEGVAGLFLAERWSLCRARQWHCIVERKNFLLTCTTFLPSANQQLLFWCGAHWIFDLVKLCLKLSGIKFRFLEHVFISRYVNIWLSTKNEAFQIALLSKLGSNLHHVVCPRG